MSAAVTDEAFALDMATRSPYPQGFCLRMVQEHGRDIADMVVEFGCRGVPMGAMENALRDQRAKKGGAS